jgi:2-methylcitrate dehydratase PrpD
MSAAKFERFFVLTGGPGSGKLSAAMGIFGATAAAGKLLGLSVEQMVHAFGIALSYAAGNRQCIVDGALTKRLQAGQAASSGVFAAVLAREGFTGAQHVFAGRYGFFPMYQPDGYDLQELTNGLGTIFRGEEISFKPYPCGRRSHATVDVALALYQQLDLATAHEGQGIAEVIVTTDPQTYRDQFAAGTTKRRPTMSFAAKDTSTGCGRAKVACSFEPGTPKAAWTWSGWPNSKRRPSSARSA